MTMLQEQAVRMIQDMSDDNVGFLLEVIQRLIPKKTYTSVIYPSQKSDEKMQAFKELVATRYEAKKYLPDDFDPDVELEAARKESIKVCENGAGVDFSEEEAAKILHEDEIYIDIDLHQGDVSAKAWGCDLTYEYVKINGDYRS